MSVKKSSKWKHADFLKGEIPTRKAEIDLQYIFNYCKQDHEKAKWFLETMQKYSGERVRHLKVRKEFVDKYFPQFNEKPKMATEKAEKKKTQAEIYMDEMSALLKTFE